MRVRSELDRTRLPVHQLDVGSEVYGVDQVIILLNERRIPQDSLQLQNHRLTPRNLVDCWEF